jgi:PPM family protein phosphatase
VEVLHINFVIYAVAFSSVFSSFFFQGRKPIPSLEFFSSLSKTMVSAFKFGFPSFIRGKQKESDLKKEPSKPSFGAEEIGCLSDVGKVREIDEDSLFVARTDSTYDGNPRRIILMIVADGMGGHSKGEVASALGVATVAGLMLPKLIANQEGADYSSLLTSCIKEANQQILQRSIECPECEGMGTTMTVMLVDSQKLYVGHVGDTRAYLISEENSMQLTKDHSLVQQMVDRAEITAEQARTHPQKNVITRVVGYYADVDVDVCDLNWDKNDRVLMCCDGLIAHVEDHEIAATVLSSITPQSACRDLVKQANDRGGKDNISVIVTPRLGTLFEETKHTEPR